MSSSTHDLLGHELRASDGRPIGKITAVYRYPADLHAPWGAAEVTRGSLITSTHVVDLQDADLGQEAVRVPHSRHTINAAPRCTPLIGDTLADDDAMQVRTHYWGAAQPA